METCTSCVFTGGGWGGGAAVGLGLYCDLNVRDWCRHFKLTICIASDDQHKHHCLFVCLSVCLSANSSQALGPIVTKLGTHVGVGPRSVTGGLFFERSRTPYLFLLVHQSWVRIPGLPGLLVVQTSNDAYVCRRWQCRLSV